MKKNKGKTLFLCLLIAVLLMPVRAAETENTTAPEETTETAAPAVPDPTLPPEETTEPEPIPIDYSDLSYRIAVANGLDPAEYTAESWSGLENALSEARYALYSGYQSSVDWAAEQLRQATEALVKMDYSELENALEALRSFRDTNPELYDVWVDTASAVPEAEALRDCRDQATVDGAAARLTGLLAKLREQVDALTTTETVVVTERVEVPVEVEPTTPYCNIEQHGLWPKLLIASGALNLVLALGWVLTARKKAIRQDNMPLVDYDIDDDDPA